MDRLERLNAAGRLGVQSAGVEGHSKPAARNACWAVLLAPPPQPRTTCILTVSMAGFLGIDGIVCAQVRDRRPAAGQQLRPVPAAQPGAKGDTLVSGAVDAQETRCSYGLPSAAVMNISQAVYLTLALYLDLMSNALGSLCGWLIEAIQSGCRYDTGACIQHCLLITSYRGTVDLIRTYLALDA